MPRKEQKQRVTSLLCFRQKSIPSLYQKKDRGRHRVRRIGKFLSVCWQIFNSLGKSLFLLSLQENPVLKIGRHMKCTRWPQSVNFHPDVSVILKVSAPTSVKVNIF